jgi:peroxidase
MLAARMNSTTLFALVSCLIFAFCISTIAASPLKVGFYGKTCPSAEEIVKKVVDKAISKNPGLGAGLIRMHFHDCFVRGCDGSVLLDSKAGKPAEKDHPANNPSLRGYEVIDAAKAELEYACPKTVSCSDILAFAARDSSYKLGNINYQVPSGRRDGTVSVLAEVTQNLPPPSFNVQQLKDNFARKGLSLDEMVTLSGAHSIGVSHCSSFLPRLYTFNSTHPQDPSLDRAYATLLKKKCPRGLPNGDPTVPLEPITPNGLDNKYYTGLKSNRGLLFSDDILIRSPSTASIVTYNANYGSAWAKKYAAAMVKMGNIEVLTGNQGQIRKKCRFVN